MICIFILNVVFNKIYRDEDEMQNDSPHSSVVKTSHYRKHTQIKTKTSIFKGGCIDHPASPVNGNIQCSLDRQV